MHPIPTVDILIENSDAIVLVMRKKSPFKNKLAIPGGFVELEETIEAAAVREAQEETSLDVKLLDILGVYSDPKRDPRNHVLSIVFVAKQIAGTLKGRDDALSAKWYSLDCIDSLDFAFDHKKIIQDFIKWKSRKGTFWSTRTVDDRSE